MWVCLMNIKHTSCPLASGYKEKVAGHLLCTFGNFPLAPTLKAPLRCAGRFTGAGFTLLDDVYRSVQRTAGRGVSRQLKNTPQTVSDGTGSDAGRIFGE